MWSLYNANNEFLEPLKFSNGKTQSHIVDEVLKAIKEGTKIILIHGVCGTGKSAIALNIAKELGKTSIVVPGKNLQNQYKKDYENNKYLKKDNGEKLKISVITGRNNHKCKFLEDNSEAIPIFKKEENLKLNTLFEGLKKKINNNIGNDLSADNLNLPCKIEIREKNWEKIKEYLKQNNKINWADFDDIKDVRRLSIAPVCPYWSPVISDNYDLKFSGEFVKRKYQGINGEYAFYQRKEGCPFYEQFNSYIDADVIIFNSQKYKIEFALGRKPKTEADVIDECDEFLDSFSNQRTINIDRLQNSLLHLVSTGIDKTTEDKIGNILKIIKEIKNDGQINEIIQDQKIVSIKETLVSDLVNLFLKDSFLGEIDADDGSYILETEETAKIFEEVLDDTYLIIEKNKFEKEKEQIMINLVTTNLAKKFKELVDKNEILILMSGTLHSENVLKNIFGITNYKMIYAETESQGEIEIARTGLEKDCKYENFSRGVISREEYLKSLDKCVDKAKKPLLVHVNAYYDLPSSEEISRFKLKNVLSREKLVEMQKEDKESKIVLDFKNKDFDVLFTTKCGRGVDFPGEECNSIVFTKFPNPDAKDPFWKILKQTKPAYYWDFYRDKAKRELLQKIYRGLRFKNDHIFLMSPDDRVLKEFEK